MNTSPHLGILLAATVLVSCSRAPEPIREVAGCYAVTRSTWVRHPLSVEPTAPPDTIRLSTERIEGRGSTNRYVVTPSAFDLKARGAASWWTREGDSIKVMWAVAYAWVDLRLSRADSGLVGSVESRTDVRRVVDNVLVPWPTATVYLRRSRCAAAA